jgi:uncharacterized caspase-like protein
VDAKVRSPEDVRNQAVDVSELLRFMDQAKDKSFLVILDACRDDPFGASYKASNKGLSQFDGPVGSLLAYSTAPGNVAMDGSGSNGLYTSHLLRELAVRNTKLEDAFKRVRLNVRLESGGKQIPWESTSLEEDIYLFKGEAKKLTEAETEVLIEKEVTAWKSVRTSTDPRILANFIREFPSGSTSELAQARLNRILVGLSAERARAQAAAEAAEAAAQAQLAEKAAREAKARAEAVRLAEAKAQQIKADEEAAKLAEAKRQEAFRLARQREEQQLAAAAAAAARLEAEKVKAAEAQRAEAQRLAAQREAQAAELARAQEAQRQEAARLALAQAAQAKLEEQRLATLRLEAERAQQAARLAEIAKDQQAEQAAREARALAAQVRLAEENARQMEAERETARLAEMKRQEEWRVAAELQLKAMREERTRETQRQEALRLASQKDEEQRVLAGIAAAQAQTERMKALEAEEQRQRAVMRLAEAQALEARQAEEQLVLMRAQAEKARLAALEEAERAIKMKEAAALAAAAPAAAGVLLASADSNLNSALVVPATPFFMGSNVFARQYSVGDQFGFRVIDSLNHAEKPLTLRVSAVDLVADRVEFNAGEYTSDLMGNITRNLRGSLDAPRQFYPAELYIGKKWKTQFKQNRASGVVYTFKYELRVVAKEVVTVPAGTFDTYKIEARGFNMELGAYLQRNIWVAPGVSADIAHETLVRLRNGQLDQNDRQELVQYAPASRVASNGP